MTIGQKCFVIWMLWIIWVFCIEIPFSTYAMHLFLGAVVPLGVAVTFSFYWTTVPLLITSVAMFVVARYDYKRKEKIRKDCMKELEINEK